MQVYIPLSGLINYFQSDIRSSVAYYNTSYRMASRTLDAGAVRKLAVRWEPTATDNAFEKPNFNKGVSIRDRKGVPELNKKFLQEMLEKEIPSVEVVSFTVETGDVEDSILEVNVMTTDNGTVHLIFKTMHVTPEEGKVRNIREVFKKEVLMYQKVIPQLNAQFSTNPLNMFAPSFHSRSDVLVFENLRTLGFKELDRVAGLDGEHATLVLSELGRFHGATIALQSRGSTDLEEAGKEIIFTHQRRAVYEQVFQELGSSTVEIIRKNAEASRYLSNVEEILKKRYDILLKLLTPSKGNTNVLNHGELWTGNLLFRYDDRNVPKQVVLLDLQSCRYGSPGLDINHLLYTSLTSEVRRAYYDDLLRSYHRSLERTLRQLGIKTSFTLFELRQEVEKTALYGLLVAEHSLKKFFNKSASNDSEDIFAERFADIVIELGDHGRLKI